MKWLKHLLDVFTLTLISLFLMVLLYEEDSEILTGSQVAIQVEGWDYQYSKAEVFDRFERVAKDLDIVIFKVITDHKKGQVDKAIYTFNKKANHHTITPMNRSYSYQQLTLDDLMKRDVRGDYFILDSVANPHQIKAALESVGLKVAVVPIKRWMIYIDVLINRGVLLPFVTLLIIYILYHLYDRSKNFKTYATMRLHGYRFYNIFFLNIKKIVARWFLLAMGVSLFSIGLLKWLGLDGQLGYFISHLILADIWFWMILFISSLLSYILLVSMNVPLMIKGLKPYRLLHLINHVSKLSMLVLLTLLILPNFNQLKKLEKIQETETWWGKLDDYYMIELKPIRRSINEERNFAKRFHQMIVYSEQHEQALLMRQNVLAEPSETNFVPGNGNVLFVNQNFVDFFKSQLQDLPRLEDREGQVELYLPPQAKTKAAAIRDDFQEWVDFQLPNSATNTKVKVTQVDNPYQIYAFDVRTGLSTAYLKSPAILMLNAKDLTDDFYYATLSQGTFIFKNYENIIRNIDRFNLKDDVQGVTNYKDNVIKKYREAQTQWIVYSFSSGLAISVLFIVTLLDVLHYFEQHRQWLLMRKMFGFRRWQNYRNYIILNGLFTALIGAFLFEKTQNSNVIWLFAIVLLFQFFVQWVYIHYLEKQFNVLIREV
ncbi:DUF1430 domain-containing protein [Staphylococcus pseudintermedius]|uniref:DUF1430 domain-containing protein n=1 Tax=Staphylococcus pseudintermedius TaxID=283734 RepID=UPI00398012C4